MFWGRTTTTEKKKEEEKQQPRKKMKICCACPETKEPRDQCIGEFGAEGEMQEISGSALGVFTKGRI